MRSFIFYSHFMDEEAELQRDYPSALHPVGQKTPRRVRMEFHLSSGKQEN